MSNRQFFIKHFENEIPIFERLIKAVPDDKGDYRPHPRSRSAGEILSLFVAEIEALNSIIETGLIDWREPDAIPVSQALERWQKACKRYLDNLKALTDEEWEKRPGEFRVEDGRSFTIPVRDFAWWTLFDLIHHRGQLSVYLRLMGEKVPAIYGSSADEKVEF